MIGRRIGKLFRFVPFLLPHSFLLLLFRRYCLICKAFRFPIWNDLAALQLPHRLFSSGSGLKQLATRMCTWHNMVLLRCRGSYPCQVRQEVTPDLLPEAGTTCMQNVS